MPCRPLKLSDKAALPFKTGNKLRRQDLHLKQKRARDALKRAERFSRKKEEEKNPKLKAERLRKNVPATIDRKRVYDEVDAEPEDGGLGMVYDVERLKRRKLAEEQDLLEDETDAEEGDDSKEEDDNDSMLDSDSGSEAQDEDGLHSANEAEEDEDPLPSKAQLRSSKSRSQDQPHRSTSPTRSTTSTNLSLAPAALAAKFPTLFPSTDDSEDTPTPLEPKILITTSINSTLHSEAAILTSLFPYSKYIRRSSHRYGYKFSVREISLFAAKHDYTSVIVLEEDQKKPSGMTIVHLPTGPTFHFTISNWYTSKSIPGHGRATGHIPELILNNFTTPLGLLTAHLFRSLFPAIPDLQGRQVLTLHNQRDYIFLRRHRYVFREKRETEKAVVGADGKEIQGAVKGIRAGLQELGPRLTLKLRRVDKGIQRKSGQDWEWKSRMEKVRTKFQL
jgi:ribosome production factor 1